MRLAPDPPTVPDAVLRGLDPLDRTLDGRPLAELLAGAYGPISDGAHARVTGSARSAPRSP